MVYAVCVVFKYYDKGNFMKKVVKKIAVTIIVIATTIIVVNWTISQLEEGYSPSYPSKLDELDK